jgi:hypothetical protein
MTDEGGRQTQDVRPSPESVRDQARIEHAAQHSRERSRPQEKRQRDRRDDDGTAETVRPTPGLGGIPGG